MYQRLRARYEARVQYLRGHERERNREPSAEEERKEERSAVSAAPPAEACPCTVGIIIPSRDNPEMLSRCLRSLCDTVHPERERLQPEIIVVDNGSSAENREKINEIINNISAAGLPCRYLYREEPFSFSRMCNAGAQEAEDRLLLFLNDDVEALSDGWLSEMAAFALTEGIGAVGAKLLYPGEEKRIQHCGIVNMRIGPVHVLNGLPDGEKDAEDFHVKPVEVIAVTGACLMLEKDLFTACGNFREALPVAFNDVDLCYTLFEKGYRNVSVNSIALTHHESFSRGDDTLDIRKTMRLAGEYRVLMEAHADLIGTDPFRRDALLKEADLDAEASARGQGAMSLRPVRPKGSLPADAREDAVCRVGVEYANRLMLALKKEEAAALPEKERAMDYYIRGYSFVIGADNALYDRQVLLQRIHIEEDGAITPRSGMYCFRPETFYRPDIEARTPDQTNNAMSGFHLLIARGTLPDGVYRIGILAVRRWSRQKVWQWGKTVLYVNDG
ncbi:MAG: glycosyltransferase [Lachnospiraceae bacterium]|nr:glycosyltransferase [Lachnospiraceae bacterium]